MTTSKLLWGMTWRGALWGLGIGSVLSAIYGSLLTFGIVYKSFLPSLLNLPFAIGAPSTTGGGIIAFPIMVISGSILGVLFGAPIGFVGGIVGSLALGIIEKLFLIRVFSATSYTPKIIASIISVFYGLSAGLYSFQSTYFNVLEKNLCYPYPCTLDSNILTWFIIVPSIIAGLGALIVNYFLLRWYERESAKGSVQNVSAN